MTSIQNLHTHCTYCDGKSSMEDMIKSAINHNLKSLGFSSHCPTDYPCDFCYVKDIDSYFSDIEKLKEKYEDKITIFSGLEYESSLKNGSLPEIDSRCEYSIISTHYLRHNNNYWTLDNSSEEVEQAAEDFGSYENLVKAYFESTLKFLQNRKPSIIGHFDLLTKFKEKTKLPFTEQKWYIDICLSYIELFSKFNIPFEVNTGAISRGYRTTPYPDVFILKRLKELNIPIIITSDSHHKDTITCCFEETENLLKNLGYTNQVMLTKQGFVEVDL